MKGIQFDDACIHCSDARLIERSIVVCFHLFVLLWFVLFTALDQRDLELRGVSQTWISHVGRTGRGTVRCSPHLISLARPIASRAPDARTNCSNIKGELNSPLFEVL